MRRAHLEAFAPRCPRCASSGLHAPLVLGASYREEGEHVLFGKLECSHAACWSEYPILDGVPVILSSVRETLAQQGPVVLLRDDLPAETEGLLADCMGPGTTFDTTRQHLSNYVWDHYAQFDPQEDSRLRPGSGVGLLERGLELSGPAPAGLTLDAGCSVGRTTFELAARREGLVLGVDLNLSMLRLAARVLREGVVRYPRRRVGVVYDRREFPVAFEGAERVDFWACDASALPFADDAFGLVNSLNLLDCLANPHGHLSELSRTLCAGGKAVLATPHDWSPGATAIECWVGGHSQRGPEAGASEPVLRNLLTPGKHPAAVSGLAIVGEELDAPWRVRLHDRSSVDYRAQVLALEGTPLPKAAADAALSEGGSSP